MRQAPVRSDALGFFRSRREPRFDGAAPLLGQPSIGVGLQLRFGDRELAHLTSFSLVEGVCPSIMARSFSRARDRRDITVPMGMPSVRATSS